VSGAWVGDYYPGRAFPTQVQRSVLANELGYVRLLAVKNQQASAFYEDEAIRGGWTGLQLDRQIQSQFYERTEVPKYIPEAMAEADRGDVMDAETDAAYDCGVFAQRRALELAHSTEDHDPNELVRAKQFSREADARALASGQKTREQLRAENTLVSVAYDELVIDFSHCSPGSLR